MINKILSLASKYVPVGIGIKGIGKIDPRLEKFFTAAALSGYGADEAMDFLRNKLEGKTEANKNEEDRLDQGSSQGTLRPDEAASRQRINESNRVPRAIQKAIAIGAGGVGGSRALADNDLENNEEPQPKSGNEGNQLSSAPPKSPNPIPPNGAANFISQHPELGQYLDQLIQSGMSPEQAATQAKTVRKLQPSIQDIESKLGQDLVSIISYLFGKGKSSQKQSEGAQKSSGGIEQALSMLRDLQSKIKAPRG